MGVQCMMCKFVSSTFAAYSSCFHPGDEEQWPIPETLKHIFCFSRVICRRSMLLLQSLLPRCPLPPCRPFCIWAAGLGDGLNLTKVIFRREEGPPQGLLLFPLSSWDAADIWWRRNCHVGLGAQRENRGTARESSQLGVQNILPGLRSSVTGWQLSPSSPLAASHPLIMPHCAAKAGFESAIITTVAKWLEICRVFRNSSGPFWFSLFSLSQHLRLSWAAADYLWRLKNTKSFQTTPFPACLRFDSCICLHISAWRRCGLHTAHD